MTNKTFSMTIAITNAVTNMMNPPTLTGGVGIEESKTFVIVRHARIVNKTAAGVTATLYRGATGASAAGTEVMFNGTSVPANSFLDYYGMMYFNTGDFLTAVAGSNTALVLTLEGEIGVAD